MGIAAYRRPDLFSGLIIIDSPYFSLPKRLLSVLLFSLPEATIRNIHPFIIAANKKPSTWSSKQEAEAYFRGTKLFSRFDPRVLDIFQNECIKSSSDGTGKTELLFSCKAETDIYFTAPPEISWYTKRQYLGLHDFNTPAYFLHSSQYHLMTKLDVFWIKTFSHHNERVLSFEGGHFWPLERPEECARRIAQLIEALNSRIDLNCSSQ
jgi:hypothetical protein